MKYESAILKRLINTYGVVGDPHYISEIIKEFIVQGKECYPNLFTYQSDWLAHIDEFGLSPSYTVSYTGQTIYAPNTLEKPIKSANLKGSTKYRDIETGEILEVFEDGRNLELVSVKMPVLKTKNKQTFVDFKEVSRGNGNFVVNSSSDGREVTITAPRWEYISYVFDYEDGRSYTFKADYETDNYIIDFYSVNGRQRRGITGTGTIEFDFIPQLTDGKVIDVVNNLHGGSLKLSNIELCPTSNKDEPYKSNILTVNEDVTLRSNGSVCDELDLLTGKLTQRIDEDGEILAQEVVKIVDLTILDQNGQNVKQLMSFNGGTHFTTSSQEGSPLPVVSVSVETDLGETLKICSLEGNTL